jgi:hypothetical protein
MVGESSFDVFVYIIVLVVEASLRNQSSGFREGGIWSRWIDHGNSIVLNERVGARF